MSGTEVAVPTVISPFLTLPLPRNPPHSEIVFFNTLLEKN